MLLREFPHRVADVAECPSQALYGRHSAVELPGLRGLLEDHARDLHPGGAQFCFAGGAVQFLNQSTDPVLLENLGNRSDGAMMGEF